MKTIAVIPCHNEQQYIGRVVMETRKWVDEVIVADDFSTDFSIHEAKLSGAITVEPQQSWMEAKGEPSGKGRTLLRGIESAKAHGADILVFLDGDGQHNPAYIPALLKPILNNEADVCLGMRTYAKMPRRRRVGIELLSMIYNFRNHQKLSDPMTGFWAIRNDAIPSPLTTLNEREWGLEIELLTKCQRMRQRFKEVPVEMIYHRNYSENSTTDSWRLGIKLVVLICKWRWRTQT